MRRYADRRDINEKPIRSFLERCGCKVKQLSQKGVPDLLVTAGPLGPFIVLFEVKSSSGSLTEDQKQFFKEWEDSFSFVVRSRADIKKALRLFMPVRVYECPEHGVFEKKQAFSEDPLDKCPNCDKEVKQKYSVPYVIYRGNGWAGKKDE